MRPHKLTLQGFTSFAERAEIDFSNLDLFAITGPTGAGKSSILDAITWALYGKTPRLGKCGSDLISHDKSSVAVHFEFTVGMDSYRVIRTAKRKGSSQARFERFVNGDWVADEATGVVETNEAIERGVGLDFKAFNLSVILPQGKFSEFLSGEGTNRREILKSLLGHEVYDRMREMANKSCVELSARITGHEELLQREFSAATEEHLKIIRAGLRQVKKAGHETAARVGQALTMFSVAESIGRERAALESNELEHARHRSAYLQACGEAEQKAEEVAGLKGQSEVLQCEHDGIVIDERRAAELLVLSTRAGELDRLIVQQGEARTRRDKTQHDLASAESEQAGCRQHMETAEEAYRRAEEARRSSQQALDEITSHGSGDLLARLLEDLGTVTAKSRTADGIDEQIAATARKQEELRTRVASLYEQRTAAESELKNARVHEQDLMRHALHRELRASLRPGEACPVCEQTVSVLPKVPAADELDAAGRQVHEHEKTLQKLRDGITRAETELAGIPGQVRQFESQRNGIMADVAAIRERVHAVTGNLQDDICSRMLADQIDGIRTAERELKAATSKEADAQKTARDFTKKAADLNTKVAKLATTLAAVEAELNRLAEQVTGIQPEIENAGGRDRIRLELEALEAARTKKAQMADELRKLQLEIAAAEQKKSEAEKRAAVLAERTRSLTADIEKLKSSLAELESQWAAAITGCDMPPGASETERAAKWRDRIQKEHDNIRQRISDLEAQAKAISQKIEHRAELERQVEELRSEWEIYQQIHTALRADRFIDYLLGRAYNDLCHRGSEHLWRLSGERYSFAAGKNTFNVKDGWHGDAERPASTLSGGESFFASLALALALAESVSTFSADGTQAARLEALFLDEGVSTLDQDDALPAVVDALMNLQAGDRMIGVISHMENLAQRLPARIEVVRNHGRSTIRTEGYSPDIQLVAGLT